MAADVAEACLDGDGNAEGGVVPPGDGVVAKFLDEPLVAIFHRIRLFKGAPASQWGGSNGIGPLGQ